MTTNEFDNITDDELAERIKRAERSIDETEADAHHRGDGEYTYDEIELLDSIKLRLSTLKREQQRRKTEGRRAAVLLGSLLEAAERYLEWKNEDWYDPEDRREWQRLETAIKNVKTSLGSEGER